MSFTDSEIDRVLKAKVTLRDLLDRKAQLFSEQYKSDVFDFLRLNCWLTGGAVASLLQGQHPKDFDFYVRNSTSCSDAVLQDLFIKEGAPYYDLVQTCNPSYMGMEQAGRVITANAITLKAGIQIIRLANFETSRKNFDFIHCMPYYDWDKLYISRQQLDSILTKTLVPNPESRQLTHHRLQKFKERGWKLNHTI